MFYSIGRVTHITNVDSVSENRGVLPHHYCVQTIEDYLLDVDTPLEYTMKLIQNK